MNRIWKLTGMELEDNKRRWIRIEYDKLYAPWNVRSGALTIVTNQLYYRQYTRCPVIWLDDTVMRVFDSVDGVLEIRVPKFAFAVAISHIVL